MNHDTVNEERDAILDDVAERARVPGGHAAGTLAEFLKRARVRNHGK